MILLLGFDSGGVSKLYCIFASTCLPRFPSDQRAQGKLFFALH